MFGVVADGLEWFFSVDWVRRVLFAVGGGLRRRVLGFLCGVGLVDLRVLVRGFGGGYGVDGFRRWVLGPLVDAGLIVLDGGVRVSDVGRGVWGFIGFRGVPGFFSRSGRCYEAVVVLELDRWGGLGFDRLRGLVPFGSLRRVLRRLAGFVVGERVEGGWRVGVGGSGVLGGLEARVFDVVRGRGVVSAGFLAGILGVHRRTVYKCLARLRAGGWVERVKGGVVYRLGEEGRELAGYLKCLLGQVREYVVRDVGVGLSFLKCLVERGYPVSEREVFDECFKGGVGLDRFGYVRDGLKKLGLIVGNLYTGYVVSRVFWDMVKNI